ncbi:HesB/IscA family protein [Acetobacter orientalis]|uniref:Fe-S cluster assembly protein HesB n=1 Tax=Acetobacter orientalis TaxID=146474 RepID=A0A252BDN7_9PROT|nr:iron-sulfur cluster assembly accessory protein [Acetobacter orientalis]MDN6041609.1 iron-sulfur cluster assembly accessory protein [Acetobacter sp.]MCP1214497.1 iron-sulfur cluster assembly accessory protein [Acetobacter orientalis]MCP1218079.1 iron-sulfur cluster assembly accessory protein [Acetobacter orientalis]OUJ02503.1 Fe-S cluster assembly protein HesB [Acetobacter orientalis]GAN65207.1 iron-sulfur (Fe-S) cluster assembly protein [Acetobacter orientalis]
MSQATVASSPAKRELPPLMRLSDAAARQLEHLYKTAHAGQTLRISVTTKGCSGKAYDMQFVDAPEPGDDVVKDKGLTLLVDHKAVLFLIGSEMDFQQTDLEEGFVFSNPNEKGRCGCGESFHV